MKRTPLIAAAVVIVVALLVVVAVKSAHHSSQSTATNANSALQGSPAQPTSGTKTYDFEISNGSLVKGPTKVQVKVGDYLLFHVKDTTDKDAHFIVQNYGLRAEDLADDEGGELYFKADKTGTFQYGLEDPFRAVGELVVGE